MPQSGNQLDLMAPLMRRKNLLAKLAAQLGNYQARGTAKGGIGAASRAAVSTPSGLRSVMGSAASAAARAVNPGLTGLPPQAMPNVDLSGIPSGGRAPVAAGPDPSTAPVGTGPGPDGAAAVSAPEAPAASATAAGPYDNWESQGFVSKAAMEEFYSLPEDMQMRLLDNYVTRRRFTAI